jgi:hypothetical protein
LIILFYCRSLDNKRKVSKPAARNKNFAHFLMITLALICS